MNASRIVRNILWTIVTILLIAFLHAVGVKIMHAAGGGEIHQVFAYSGGGRIYVAEKIYWAYIIIACLISFILIFLRYPFHWCAVSAVATLIVGIKWLRICYFPFQSRGFYPEQEKRGRAEIYRAA